MVEAAAKRFALTDLTQVEEVVGLYAKSSKCNRYGIQPEHFDVRLVSNMKRGQMEILPGNPVTITLLWPPVSDGKIVTAMSVVKWQLESAFRQIARLHLYRTLEVVPMALVQDMRKFYKEKFGDLGEILPDLVPRHRLRVITETVITLIDTKTGEKASMKVHGKPERYEGDNVGLWIELSRRVREYEPPLTDDLPEIDESPITIHKEPEVIDGE